MKALVSVIEISHKRKEYGFFNRIISGLIWTQMNHVLKVNQVIHP